MKLRLGLIGLGSIWETRHKPALRALSDRFEVRAVCSPVCHRAEQVAREFDADPCDGYQSLCAREDVDAVLYLSPLWYGSLPLLAACDAGKAIYCGTMLNLTLEDAARLRKRVDSSGVAFVAEFARRQAPATLRLKELIATRLGNPEMLFCHLRRSAKEANPHSTRPHDPRNVGARLPELVELVDWCRYIVGESPISVSSAFHQTGASASSVDYEMLSMEFAHPTGPPRSIVAQISSGQYVPSSWPEAISFRPPSALQIVCERGMAFVDLPTSLVWFDEAGRHQESLESERPVGEQLLASFHRSVTSLVRRSSDLEDAYQAISIVLAGRESCQTGRRIGLALGSDDS